MAVVKNGKNATNKITRLAILRLKNFLNSWNNKTSEIAPQKIEKKRREIRVRPKSTDQSFNDRLYGVAKKELSRKAKARADSDEATDGAKFKIANNPNSKPTQTGKIAQNKCLWWRKKLYIYIIVAFLLKLANHASFNSGL